MRSPARALAGNLRFTRTGTVWADWVLRPLPYGFRPDKDKHVVRALHQALFRALPGESLLLGVCAGLDAAAVVERMIDEVDLESCPDWAAECEATLDTLDAIGPGQRVFWLSVPLGHARGRDRLAEPLRSAAAGLRDTLALPRSGVPEGELTRRLVQARKVAAAVPAPFRPHPASPAQMLWLHAHAQQRGLAQDLDLPQPAAARDAAGQLPALRAGTTLSEPLLDEGGQSDLDRRQLRAWNPAARRYLKITQPGRPDPAPASYQALLVLSDVPSEGMVFPGSEFIGRIDECGLDVDWALRLHVLSSHEVASRNRRALVNLNEQYGQREGELSHGLNALDRAAAELAEYAAVLDSDKLEVEAQATVVFAVAAPDPAGAAEQARALADYLGGAGYRLTQPLGYQEDLWWAMQPGAPANKAVREFAQITTSRALAAAVPLASTDLGDRKGSLLGLNISTGRPGVALHDIAGASARDVSGSLAIAGELGSGKALALDTPVPTPGGWARMGDLAPGDQVFDELGNPTTVLGVSPVMTGHRCYDVVFSDATTITADAEHLWSTWDVNLRRSYDYANPGDPPYPRDWATWAPAQSASRRYRPGERDQMRRWRADGVTAAEIGAKLGRTAEAVLQQWHQPEAPASGNPPRTTVEVGRSLRRRGMRNHGIPAAGPLDLPAVDLPIEPYVLGYLLGDGDTRGRGRVACDPRDRAWLIEEFQAAGYDARPYSDPGHFGVPGLRPVWHGLGLHVRKHVPGAYLRASAAQRLALVQGLVDSDGTVDGHGCYRFTTTSAALAEGFSELVTSLGCVARTYPRPKRVRAGTRTAPSWDLVVPADLPLSRLPRKALVARRSWKREQLTRYVVDVREAASVPVRCIRVAAPSGLFLAGRTMIPTHNSLTLKSLAGAVVDRGGRVIVADRTPVGEYATWARSVTRAIVVDVNDPAVSLDPLRLFGASAGSRVTQSFLTPLLNIAPTSERGVLLADVLDPHYLAGHGISGLGGLLAHLGSGCALPGAGELARTMNVFARRDFGRVIFDESLPPLRPQTPAVVIRTHTLELPTRGELEQAHLFAQMRLEKLYGRAVYALIAALARQICFSDPDVLGVFVVDEAHHVTASPEGEREIVDFVRDGRKHKASVALGSHDPEEDFGSPTLRGLIPTRILMRHRDKTLARRGLAWLDLDPADDDLVQLLTEDTSPVDAHGVEEHRRGEAFLRDSSGNVGRIKVLAPSLPARNAAVRTSPPQPTAAGPAEAR